MTWAEEADICSVFRKATCRFSVPSATNFSCAKDPSMLLRVEDLRANLSFTEEDAVLLLAT